MFPFYLYNFTLFDGTQQYCISLFLLVDPNDGYANSSLFMVSIAKCQFITIKNKINNLLPVIFDASLGKVVFKSLALIS